MSCKVNIDELSEEHREKIDKELTIRIEPGKYGCGVIKYLYPYKIIDNVLYLPFAYAYRNLELKRPERKLTSKINVKFEGGLREEQKIIKKEAIELLNKTGSVIISAYTGCGKCLGFNTPVLMYDGTIKMVQDIKCGEQIMGDDSMPRNILNICRGEEQMYEIKPIKGESFKCNESHILSLKISENNIIDISVKDYLNLSSSKQCQLKYYKVGVEFEEKSVSLDPYLVGIWLGENELSLDLFFEIYVISTGKEIEEKNSIRLQQDLRDNIYKTKYDLFLSLKKYNLIDNKHILPYEYKCNSRENRLKLLAGFIDISGYFKNCYEIIQKVYVLACDILYVARSLGFIAYIIKEETYYKISISGEGLENIPIILLERKNIISTDKKELFFSVSPIEEKNYYGFEIDGNRRFLLGDFTVTHNTRMAISICCTIKLRTLFIVNKLVLIKQLKEAILQVCLTAKIQCLTTKSEIEDCDFYIMNAINIPKMGQTFFKDIQCVVVDEVHLLMAEKLSTFTNFIQPRYLIGLSATPYRTDGLNILLDLYFGKDKIIRELNHKHIVYLVDTGFTPKMEKTESGKVNWSSVLDSQSNDDERNNLIVNIVRKFKDRVFLILVKRVEHGECLEKKLIEKGEFVTSLLGTNQIFNKEARILVGTSQKVGVGFDHPRLNTLLLACDFESYSIQINGRVFRSKDTEPIIFDLLDKNGILINHWKTRKQVYQNTGGIIKNFMTSFPEFKI